jgi:hypothetical protein
MSSDDRPPADEVVEGFDLNGDTTTSSSQTRDESPDTRGSDAQTESNTPDRQQQSSARPGPLTNTLRGVLAIGVEAPYATMFLLGAVYGAFFVYDPRIASYVALSLFLSLLILRDWGS